MLFRSRFKGPMDWIVVFLGNPGSKYEGTRHNAGFMAADMLADKKGLRINRIKFNAAIGSWNLEGQSILLVKPMTYMNLSGTAVKQAMDFYKVPLDHVLVVVDDISLVPGKLRIRTNGSAGGHNGLKDIIAKCGGQDFPRVKIGVGSPPPDGDLINWVLGGFPKELHETMRTAFKRAGEAVEAYITLGPEKAMNRYN
ncbi:MAG: aminoacyl-tRNA hydrolase [Oscillospiraceae bacterium]|nr:aminoacyl-tRNA hydrolase [Oscillospiraceae bacterium]